MTRAELRARLTASEFEDWRALYDVEPFGERRMDHRIALLARQFVGAMASRRAVLPPVDAFVLKYGRRSDAAGPPKTPEEVAEKFMAIVAEHNAASENGG
jgi:hypothetical protein